MKIDKFATTTLVGGVLAAIAASTCCLGPLILVSLGIGGAWIANLAWLAPMRPGFIPVALLFMGLAYRKIYRNPAAKDCPPGLLCALPQTNAGYRILFWGVSSIVVVALLYPFFAGFLEQALCDVGDSRTWTGVSN